MKFRYKETKEEYIPANREELWLDGDLVISGVPYIGDLLVCSVREDLEVCSEQGKFND